MRDLTEAFQTVKENVQNDLEYRKGVVGGIVMSCLCNGIDRETAEKIAKHYLWTTYAINPDGSTNNMK